MRQFPVDETSLPWIVAYKQRHSVIILIFLCYSLILFSALEYKSNSPTIETKKGSPLQTKPFSLYEIVNFILSLRRNPLRHNASRNDNAILHFPRRLRIIPLLRPGKI